MRELLAVLLIFGVGLMRIPLANGQDSFPGVDLLYPEFGHPREDALAAIERHDFRFMLIDHPGTVPGVEQSAHSTGSYAA